VAELSAHSYFQTYRGLFFAALFFALVSQVASGLSSYTFYATLFQIKVSGILLVLTTVSVLALVEIGKYFLFHHVFADMFSLSGKKMAWGLLLVGLALSGLSMYASVVGGGNLGIDHARVTMAEDKFGSEIAQIRKEINEIQHRNTWKGQTWLPTKEKTLLHQKEAELARLKDQKTTTLLDIDQDNEKSKLTYQFGFGAFDLLFFLCLLFQYHYKKRCAVEYLANQTPVSKVANREETTPLPSPTPSQGLEHLQGKSNSAPLYVPNSGQKIGFMFNHVPSKHEIRHTNTEETNYEQTQMKIEKDENRVISQIENVLHEGNRICEYCGKVYVYMHNKQKYCCDNCRKEAWLIQTGKKVKVVRKE
jgi:hypothetical protein